MVIHRFWLSPNVKQVIRSGDLVTLGAVLKDRTPNDLADLITDLLPSEQLVVFRHVPRKVAVDTFQYLLPSIQERLLKEITPEEAAEILNAMSPDDRTVLLEKLPDSASQEVLKLLTPAERAVAVSLLEYPRIQRRSFDDPGLCLCSGALVRATGPGLHSYPRPRQ